MKKYYEILNNLKSFFKYRSYKVDIDLSTPITKLYLDNIELEDLTCYLEEYYKINHNYLKIYNFEGFTIKNLIEQILNFNKR